MHNTKYNMQKIFKNEKGSISLFVLLSALFFLVVVTSVGVSFKNKERSIDSQFEKIKSGYEKDVGNESAVYNGSVTKTVTFDANGGNVTTQSKVVKLGETYGELPTPTRDGYTFKGWVNENLFDPQAFYETGKDYNVSLEGNNIILTTYPYQENVTQMPVNCKNETQYTLSYDWEITNIGSGETIRSGLRCNYTDGTNDGVVGSIGINGTLGDTGHSTIISKSNKTIQSISSVGWDYTGSVKLSNIRLVEGVTEYITNDVIVTQDKDHTLTAIWEPNE